MKALAPHNAFNFVVRVLSDILSMLPFFEGIPFTGSMVRSVCSGVMDNAP